MGVRRIENGWLCSRRDGRRRVQRQFPTKAEAVALDAEIVRRRRQARDGVLDNRYHLDDLLNEFMSEKKLTLEPSTVKSYERLIENLRAGGFQKIRVESVRLQDVRQYCGKRLSGALTFRRHGANAVSVRRVNMEVSLLREALTWGVRCKMIASNPLEGCEPVQGKPVKIRQAMTAEQVSRFLAASLDRERPLWLCYLKTMMRREEVVDLLWRDVDLVRGEIRIGEHTTKNDEAAVIPVADDLLAELQRLRLSAGPGDGHVFLNRNAKPYKNNLIRSFRRTLQRAGFTSEEAERYDIHCLRVTGATEAMRAGVSPKIVQRITRHKDIRVLLDCYTLVTDQDARQAVNKLSYGWKVDGGSKRESQVGVG